MQDKAKTGGKRFVYLATAISALCGYTVIIRTPHDGKSTVLDFCRMFPTGGDRRHAEGINQLESVQLEEFLNRFEEVFRNS